MRQEVNLQAAEMDANSSKPEEAVAWYWGPSVPVPSVQEMVRKNLDHNIPERYIREPKDKPQHSSFCEATSEVPIINFSLLASGDEDERKKLDLVCREWGFFQMIDHGVAADVFQKMKAVVAAFFDEPLEVKMKYAMTADDVQGFGQPFVVSEKQKLEWCDSFILRILPQTQKQLNYWPLVVAGFREAVERYTAEIYKLNEVILANLSALMEMEKDGLKKLHGEIKQTIRMNYYPPCSRPDLVLGVSSHSDGGTLTFLIQDDEINGLQIRHSDDWITVKPIPNAIVVNLGDSLEVWSNGLYKSIEHRAVTNETAARISIATFMAPGGEADIGPVDTMVDNLNRPPMYKRIKYRDYFKQSYQEGADGKTNIELLKI